MQPNDQMQLNSISLTNFRNHEDFQLEFAPMTVLVGPNGIGKTNLLEAVYMLAVFSSYRTKSNKDLITRGADFSRLIAKTNQSSVELFIDQINPAKRIKIDGVSKKTIEALGQLVIVLFSPESLEIISGGPQLRRRFMNLILSQINKDYARALISLNRVLIRRNHLLVRIKENLAKVDELDFWDQELVKLNKTIVENRQELINFINQNLSEYYRTISNFQDKLTIKYLIKADPKRLEELLIANRDQEIKQSLTLYGPHRDELLFTLNNQPSNAGWSRGELRSAILALKMSELDFMQKKHARKITLLLDDVFSELDKNRRKQLFKLIENQQTIITTTDKDHIDQDILKKAKVVELGIKK